MKDQSFDPYADREEELAFEARNRPMGRTPVRRQARPARRPSRRPPFRPPLPRRRWYPGGGGAVLDLTINDPDASSMPSNTSTSSDTSTPSDASGSCNCPCSQPAEPEPEGEYAFEEEYGLAAATGRWVRRGPLILVDLGRGGSFAGEFREEILDGELDFSSLPAIVFEVAGGPATPSRPTPRPPGSFKPVPVESPGGGRIQDKRDPNPADVVQVQRAFKGSVPLHRLAARALDAMIRAARADGIAAELLLPVSGYRTAAKQARLWKNALAKAGGDAQEARKWVAPPGTSAHQSGRAVDLYLGYGISSKHVAAMRKTAAWRWLARNAVRFGFYPYPKEPWHWEYNPPAGPGR